MSAIDTLLGAVGLSRKAASDTSQGLPIADYLTERFGFANIQTWQGYVELRDANPIAQGCSLAYELTMPEAPLVIVQGETVLFKHPLYDLFKKAKMQRIIATAMQYMCISGNAYILKIRTRGIVTNLRVYSDQYITPVIDKYGNIAYYKFDNGFKRDDIDVDDIIHLTAFWKHPSKFWMGDSPIRLATTSVQAYNEATQSIYSLHKNDAVAKTAILYTEELTPAQQTAAEQGFKKRHTGSNRGSTAHLWGVQDIKRLGLGWNELGMNDTFMQLEARICSTYRVDPIMAYTYAGLMKSHLSNKTQASRDFTTYSRIPLWQLLQEDITSGVVDMYPDIEVRFDTSQVEALKPTQHERVKEAREAYAVGIIDRNEAREVYGYEPQALPSVASAPSKDKQRRKSFLQTLEDLDYNVTLNLAINEEVEALESAISDVIEALGRDVISDTTKKMRDVVKSIDYAYWAKQLEKATEEERLELVNKVVALAIEEVDGTQTGDDFLEAQRKGVEVSSDMIADSIGTIKTEVQDLLKANPRATNAELSALLATKFQELSTSRAAAIARTTATAATGVTQQEVWREMNDNEDDPKRKIVRQWVANPGARDAHAVANGTKENEDGLFTVGGEMTPYPAGPGLSADNSVNCRCVTRAIRAGRI